MANPTTPTNTAPTTLLLIRHGETDANASGTWQGSTDSPLNERGQRQSQLLADRLAGEGRSVTAIYASPLSRARETAAAVAAALDAGPVQQDPDLAEFRLGEWEGLSYDTIRHELRLWERMAADPHFTPPGGESAVQFAGRLMTAMQGIVGRHAGETVIVVSHGGAIGTAIAMLVDGNGNLWTNYLMANCAISEVEWAPAPRLVRHNDTRHLDALSRPRNWGAE